MRVFSLHARLQPSLAHCHLSSGSQAFGQHTYCLAVTVGWLFPCLQYSFEIEIHRTFGNTSMRELIKDK